MSPATDSRAATASLAETATSTLNLLRQFTPTLSTPEPIKIATLPADPPEPLDVLHTAATLLKAHTTKLSLLVLNKPFTPTEIRRIISDVTNTCVPAMMSAVEICHPDNYGKTLHNEVKMRVRRVFIELESMMQEVLSQTAGSGSDDGLNTNPARSTLASTGVVWEACDSLMQLKKIGTIGLVVKKAQEYREMLEDAMNELKEWAESEEEDDDDIMDDFADSDGADSVEKMLNSANSLPKDRTDLRDTLNTSLKKLKLVSTLYQALIKRRLKTVDLDWNGGPSPSIATRLDHVVDILKRIPEETDELASAFYDLDDEGARKIMTKICESGKDTVKLTTINWKSKEDEFTTWSSKWIEAIDKN